MRRDKGHVDSSYLDAAARVLEPAKRASDRLLAIGTGARVLDVGCGPGLDLPRIAATVGPGGQVVALDADPAMVEEAKARIEAAALGDRVRVQLGDASRLPMEGEVFDACRCDRVLMHVADPRRVVGEMARVTRPGGRIVCVEPDWGTLSIDCESTQVERKLARFTAESALACGFAGRRLLALQAGAGLADRRVEVHAVSTTDFGLARYLVCFDRIHGAAEQAGLVTPGELERLYEEMDVADRGGYFFGSLNIVVASGTKPPIQASLGSA